MNNSRSLCMKPAIALLLAVLLTSVSSSQKKCTIMVSNPIGIERTSETIEIQLQDLEKEANWLDPNAMIVVNGTTHDTLVTQRLGTLLLFQSDFGPNEEKAFFVQNAELERPPVNPLVSVKYILPRKDVAWENDRIAYRIYGGPLAGKVKNGLDVWVKRVRYPIIDTWYGGDSLKGKQRVSYHVDHGEGADMFEVGGSLGAGACALMTDSVLHQTGLFAAQTIAANGPVRTQFMVTYDNDSIDRKPYREEKIYSLDAGHNLNRIEVRYSGPAILPRLTIAAGLVKRKNTVHYSDSDGAWLSLWGQINDDTTNGYLGIGVVFPKKSFETVKEDSTHYLIIGTTESTTAFTYYAGAGWTRSGDFAGVSDWNKHLSETALKIQHPLSVTVKAE